MATVNESEVRALQILVAAGRVDPQIDWVEAARRAGDVIITLAQEIAAERIKSSIPQKDGEPFDDVLDSDLVKRTRGG